MLKFKDAARKAARSSVSAYTRAQVMSKLLLDSVSLHAAAARGDASSLAGILQKPGATQHPGAGINSLSAAGRSVLGEACRCSDQSKRGSGQVIRMLLQAGADRDAPEKAFEASALLPKGTGAVFGPLLGRRSVALAPLRLTMACARPSRILEGPS